MRVHRDGQHAAAKAGRKEHGPLGPVGLEGHEARRREAPGALGARALRPHESLVCERVKDCLPVRLCLSGVSGLDGHERVELRPREGAGCLGVLVDHGLGRRAKALGGVVPDARPLADGRALALLEQRPHVPVPANDRYAGDAVEALLGRGRAPEVEWQHRQRAVDVVARALRHEVAKVAAVVAHGGVLPVDEADVIAVDEQVGAVEVVVAQHGTPRAGAHGAHEPRYLLLALLEVVRQGPALVAQQAHDLS